jgi:hypothetical protein
MFMSSYEVYMSASEVCRRDVGSAVVARGGGAQYPGVPGSSTDARVVPNMLVCTEAEQGWSCEGTNAQVAR